MEVMNAFLLQNRRIYREPLSNNKAVHTTYGKEGEGKAETSQKTKSNPCKKGSETIYEHEKTNIIISRGSIHKGIWMLCNDCSGTLKFGMRLFFASPILTKGYPRSKGLCTRTHLMTAFDRTQFLFLLNHQFHSTPSWSVPSWYAQTQNRLSPTTA